MSASSNINNKQPDALITDHIDVWASAIKRKSTQGRGSSKKVELYGVKKLRELILELAVRGLLVPQDPSDEPASVLLKKIASEKEQLIKDKKIKKQKDLPSIDDHEKPFELPKGWEWSQLGNTGVGSTGKTPSTKEPSYFNGKVPFIGPGQITPAGVLLNSDKFLTEDGLLHSTQAIENDILMVCIGGSIGKSIICDRRIAFNQQINSITPVRLSAEFLHIAVSTKSFFESILEGSTGSATPIINRSKWEGLLVPVAPLFEQHRIVTKVNELMALCYRLEQQQETSITAHQTLVETLLKALLETVSHTQGEEGSSKFQQAWQRIAENFDLLFTTEHSINQLKQTILQLAVMGKLVPQASAEERKSPNYEPASELLKRIAAEKAQLIKEKKIKKQKDLPPISDEEKPFALPEGWEWCRLEPLSQLITKGSSPKWQGVEYTENPDDVLFVTSENVGVGEILLDKKKFVDKKFNEVEPRSILNNGDILMNIVGASIGRTAIFDRDDLANINQAVCLIRLMDSSVFKLHLLLFFNSEICRSYMFDKQVDNARANLSMGNIAKFVIPVPPFFEQHRIVTKVNELMTLCDNMLERIKATQTTQLKLTDAIAEQAIG